MRDLRELEGLVRDPDSRPHFREAVLAYQAGALRAAVVETWVAVVVDLTNKVRHLAETGDGIAKKAIGKVDAAILANSVADIQSFERGLLEQCAVEFELLSQREHDELSRLQSDRHLCAHPGFVQTGGVFSPSAELARGHLSAAIDCALSQPPASGRRLIEELQSVIDSRSWPDPDQAPAFIRKTFFDRVRPAIKANIVSLSIKCAAHMPDDAGLRVVDQETARRRYHKVLVTVEQSDPTLLGEAFTRVMSNWATSGQLSDERLIDIIGHLGTFPALWDCVEENVLSRMHALLANSDSDYLLDRGLFNGSVPSHNEIGEAYKQALHKAASDHDRLQRLVNTDNPVEPLLVPAVLDALRAAPSYRSAESRLALVVKAAPALRAEDLERLAEIVTANPQIYEANRCPSLLLQLHQETKRLSGANGVWHPMAKKLQEHVDDAWGPVGSFNYKDLIRATEPDATKAAE